MDQSDYERLVESLAQKLFAIASETELDAPFCGLPWEDLTVDRQALYLRMARMAVYEVHRGSV